MLGGDDDDDDFLRNYQPAKRMSYFIKPFIFLENIYIYFFLAFTNFIYFTQKYIYIQGIDSNLQNPKTNSFIYFSVLFLTNLNQREGVHLKH